MHATVFILHDCYRSETAFTTNSQLRSTQHGNSVFAGRTQSKNTLRLRIQKLSTTSPTQSS